MARMTEGARKADPSLRQTLRKTQGVLRTGALLRTSAALRQSRLQIEFGTGAQPRPQAPWDGAAANICNQCPLRNCSGGISCRLQRPPGNGQRHEMAGVQRGRAA